MSKATQYLGHRWTHRSAFQKTKDFGNIDLDECTVTAAKSIAPDSDDELSDSQRATKRRRIEKLAEGYLKGDALFISSARSCPQALKRTIIRHKKSSTEPGFKLTANDTPREPSPLWKDVEDDAAILARLLQTSRAELEGSELVDAEPVEDVNARASCKPQRRLRLANVSSGPSEEALRQAAALRNRKRRGTVTVTAVANAATPASDPSDSIIVTQSERVLRSRHDKREWLSRRKSRFSFGGVDVQDAADSASSPCIALSSPQSASYRRVSTSSPVKRRGQGASPERHSPQKSSHHTAPEATEAFEEPVEAFMQGDLGGRPQQPRTLDDVATPARLPPDVAAARANLPRPSFETDTPRVHPTQRAHDILSNQSAPYLATHSAPATRSNVLAEQVKPSYLQAPSTQNGTTPLMYRKRTTRPKVSERQQEPIAAPPTRRSNRRRVTFPSSEDVPASGAQAGDRQHVASHPPVLDLSFEPDYSFAPKLNMALVEEHQNRLLPTEPDSAGRTTLVKRALRRELRNSGAEFTRCDSEPPPSSQVEDAQQPALPPQDITASSSLERRSGQNTSKMSDSGRRQTWLGTQAMVARAERELFISPEKQRNTFTPINEQTPASYVPLSQEREPLKQLSQELAPSTQAMLETFGGFSTVKKPRAASVLKPTAEHTPIAIEKGKRPESRVLTDTRRSSMGTSSTSDRAKETRGSSLRFSISSFDSPRLAERHEQVPQEPTEIGNPPEASTTTSLATTAPSFSTKSSRCSTLKSSTPKPSQEERSQRRSSQAEGMFSQSQSMSLSENLPTLSFFQAAQAPEPDAPLGLLRDPSNLSQTVDDLTRDVLGTTGDMEGVLSQ